MRKNKLIMKRPGTGEGREKEEGEGWEERRGRKKGRELGLRLRGKQVRGTF